MTLHMAVTRAIKKPDDPIGEVLRPYLPRKVIRDLRSCIANQGGLHANGGFKFGESVGHGATTRDRS